MRQFKPIGTDLSMLRKMTPELILVLEVSIYSAIFSYLTFLKFSAFGMYAWDFGVYHQAIHTTVTSGKLFFSTVELPYTQAVIPYGTQFAVHFSPFFFLLLPIYAIFPSPITLLIIKSVFIGLGAIPVYFLAKRAQLGSLWGLFFSSAYLLLPALQGINWFDFQPHAFLPTLLLFTLLYLERGQVKLCLLFLILALSTIEVAPFLGLGIGLSSLFLHRKSILESLRKHNFSATLKSTPFAVILVSLTWLAVVYLTSVLFGWQDSFHPSNIRRMSLLYSLSIIQALSFDWQAKLLYILLNLGPLAFISLMDLRRLFPASLWMSIAIFSNYPAFYQIGLQYPSFVVPFVIYSSIFGFKKLQTSISHTKRALPYLAILLSATLISSAYAASPLGAFHIGNCPGAYPFGVPSISQHDVLLQNLINLIPKDSSVLTQNNIFPHVSNRLDAYVFPFTCTFQRPEDFEPTLEDYFQKVEFILVDAGRDQAGAITVFSRLARSKDFGIYAEADGSILFKKGYDVPKIIFVPYRALFNYSNLLVRNGTIVEDPSLNDTKVLYRGFSEPSGDYWYGPGVFLGRGNYSVDFRLKISHVSSSGPVHVLELAAVAWPAVLTVKMDGSEAMGFIPLLSVTSAGPEVLAMKRIQTGDFIHHDEYQTFSLQFKVDKPAGFEFVGLDANTGIDIYLDHIDLIQRS